MPRLSKQAKDTRPNNGPIPEIVLDERLMASFVQTFLHVNFDVPKPIPEFHKKLWALCGSVHPKAAMAAPRGHGKSTAVTLSYVICSLLFRQRDFVVIISNTYGQAIEFLNDLKMELDLNEKIRELYDVKAFIREREDDFILLFKDGYKCRVVARGSEQQIRGLKWNNKRPNLMIFDDAEGKEQVESLLRREKFRKWVMDDAIPAGSDHCIYRWVGTVLHFDSMLERLLNDSQWQSLRFAAHRSFDDFSNILWPEMKDEEKLRVIRQGYINQGNPDGYSAEYLNNPIAEGDSYFKRDNLLAMRPEDYESRKRYYIAFDFAISKAERADYTVGVVGGVDEKGILHIVDVRRARIDAKEILELMMALQKAYDPELFIAEAGAIQKSIGPFLNAEMISRNQFFSIKAVVPSKDKMTRARAFQYRTQALSVRFDKTADWWPVVEEEMTRFPKGVHDDVCDGLAYIGLALQDLENAPTDEELDDEEYFEMTRELPQGRNAVCGY